MLQTCLWTDKKVGPQTVLCLGADEMPLMHQALPTLYWAQRRKPCRRNMKHEMVSVFDKEQTKSQHRDEVR
jgi:hypothetical protein